MNGTRKHQHPAQTSRRRQGRSWRAVLAALLALIAVQGQPLAASLAGDSAIARAALAESAYQARTAATEARPDFRVAFTEVEDARVGQPFRYTVEVRNVGVVAGAVRVTTIVPPALTNVRVTAPGFACTRQFTPSGSQAGTLVTCTRNDFPGGAAASVTVEANAPATSGDFRLTATADPRDDVAETDEANNQTSATVQVQG